MEMEGGFFLRKKPLSSLAPVYTNSENALARRLPRGCSLAFFRNRLGLEAEFPPSLFPQAS
jgi:hypothetical protein